MDEEVKLRRKCASLNQYGQPCGSPPVDDDTRCFMHSPKHQDAAQKARSLGGQRRKAEQVTQVLFDLNDLTGLELQDRVYFITLVDTLNLEHTTGRSRALISLIKTKIDMNQHAELSQRIAELEQVIGEDNDIKP